MDFSLAVSGKLWPSRVLDFSNYKDKDIKKLVPTL
jgi:hypothetical protein